MQMRVDPFCAGPWVRVEPPDGIGVDSFGVERPQCLQWILHPRGRIVTKYFLRIAVWLGGCLLAISLVAVAGCDRSMDRSDDR